MPGKPTGSDACYAHEEELKMEWKHLCHSRKCAQIEKGKALA